MDDIATKLNIKKPSDWGKLTLQQIHQFGGASLLNTYYNDSIFACLQSIYTGSPLWLDDKKIPIGKKNGLRNILNPIGNRWQIARI